MTLISSRKISHSAFEYFSVIFIWILLWVLSGWNTYNYDIDNYIRYYYRNFNELSIINLADPGFNFINKTFNDFDIPFESYHIIIYGIILAYLFIKVWQKSYSPIAVISIYFFTAFFADIIQIRNFIALLFLYMGLFSLTDEYEKHPKIKFLLFNILASSIHIAFVFYFIFLFADYKFRPSIFIISSILLSIIGHEILSVLSNFTYVAENEFLTDRADNYLESSSIWSVVICSCQYILHFIVCKKMVGNNSLPNINTRYFMTITTLMSILIIMTSINMTFFRLFRNVLLFSSIFILNGFIRKPTKSNLLLIIIYIISMSYFHFWSGSVFDNVSLILSNNLLF